MKRESDLSAPVSRWLEGRGYTVYAEVPHYSSAIDLVGWRGDELVAVELKLTLSHKVRYQAMLAQTCCDQCYVAVGTKPRRSSLEACREVGLGVLSLRRGLVILVAPNSRWLNEGAKRRMLEQLETLEPGGIGGRACELGVGPAQELETAIAEFKKKHPRATFKEMFRAIPNHYASASSMYVAMRLVRERRAYRQRRQAAKLRGLVEKGIA